MIRASPFDISEQILSSHLFALSTFLSEFVTAHQNSPHEFGVLSAGALVVSGSPPVVAWVGDAFGLLACSHFPGHRVGLLAWSRLEYLVLAPRRCRGRRRRPWARCRAASLPHLPSFFLMLFLSNLVIDHIILIIFIIFIFLFCYKIISLPFRVWMVIISFSFLIEQDHLNFIF
jgi:hypothetical protein